MNFNHVGLCGCENCYWMGRLPDDEHQCPSCGEHVFDTNTEYNSTHDELYYLSKYEVYLLYKEFKEKRNAAKQTG